MPPSLPLSSMLMRGDPGPMICLCPTNSLSRCGRSCSASGPVADSPGTFVCFSRGDLARMDASTFRFFAVGVSVIFERVPVGGLVSRLLENIGANLVTVWHLPWLGPWTILHSEHPVSICLLMLHSRTDSEQIGLPSSRSMGSQHMTHLLTMSPEPC